MKHILRMLLVVSLLLAGCSSTDKKTDVETEKEGDIQTKEEAPKTHYNIGETAEIDGLKVTVNAVRIMEHNEYIAPEEGYQWIAVDFTFENISDKSKYIAGIFDVVLKDGDGREQNQNIWGDLSGSIDGDVLAGEKLSGEKSFTVKEDVESLTIYYKPTLSSKDPIKFKIR